MLGVREPEPPITRNLKSKFFGGGPVTAPLSCLLEILAMTQSGNQNPYESPKTSGESISAEPTRGQESHRGLPTDKLIVLATFDNSMRAHMLRNELADNGIEAKVGNETTTAIFGATIGGPSSAFWIEVLVLESDANNALIIKNRWLAQERDDDGVEIPEWTCACGETVDAGFSVCWNCDGNFDADDPDAQNVG